MSKGAFYSRSGDNMSKTLEEVKLQDGTLIRHKVVGYEGRIEGTTEIKICFTEGGSLMAKSTSGHTFQYRVVVAGESLRRIARRGSGNFGGNRGGRLPTLSLLVSQ